MIKRNHQANYVAAVAHVTLFCFVKTVIKKETLKVTSLYWLDTKVHLIS